MTGARFVAVAPVTLIEKLAKLADRRPSDAVMTMPEVVPTCEVLGVPLKRPVVLLKLAHVGLFVMENARVSPSASSAVG